MELKKLRWIKHQLSRYNGYPKGAIFLRAQLKVFGISFYIQNFKNFKGRDAIVEEGFYVSRETCFGSSKKIKCNSIEKAKQIAQELCYDGIITTFFETPARRVVLYEKLKTKHYFKKK